MVKEIQRSRVTRSIPRYAETKSECNTKRVRTRFTEYQMSELDAEFNRDSKLGSTRRKNIGNRLGLSEATVKIWFQNRRRRRKNRTAQQVPVSPKIRPESFQQRLQQEFPQYFPESLLPFFPQQPDFQYITQPQHQFQKISQQQMSHQQIGQICIPPEDKQQHAFQQQEPLDELAFIHDAILSEKLGTYLNSDFEGDEVDILCELNFSLTNVDPEEIENYTGTLFVDETNNVISESSENTDSHSSSDTSEPAPVEMDPQVTSLPSHSQVTFSTCIP